MPTRRSLFGLAAALPLAAAAPIRTLTASEYAFDEGGNLRLNPELAGSIVDAAVAGGYLYLSLAGVRIQILRWAGGTTLPEIIYGAWDGQRSPWKLRPAPDGRIVAYSEDGCVAVLG